MTLILAAVMGIWVGTRDGKRALEREKEEKEEEERVQTEATRVDPVVAEAQGHGVQSDDVILEE